MSLTLPGQPPIFLNNLSPLVISGQHTYIVRLLRRVESSLSGRGTELLRARLGKVIQRLSHADDLQGALENLYAVEGFDTLAMRLMWMLEKPVPPSDGLENVVMDYEVDQMSWILRPYAEASPAPMPPSSERPLDAFYEALHRFGKSVEGLRRPLPPASDGEPAEVDLLYRLLNDCAALETSAVEAGNETVVRFCRAFGRFTQYVLDEQRIPGERVLNILDNANMTLQTVLESCTMEEDDALHNMIALLDDPQRLLD